MEAALAAPIEDADFEGPFSEFPQWFAARFACNVVFEWHAMALEGVDGSPRIQLGYCHPVPAEEVLVAALGQAAQGFAMLDSYTRGNVLVVTTTEEVALRGLHTRIYPLGALLDAIRKCELHLWARHDAPASPDVRAGRFGLYMADAPTMTVDAVQLVIDVLLNAVQPESWLDNGGRTGRIAELGGSLIITQTPRGHDEIARMLLVLEWSLRDNAERVPLPEGMSEAEAQRLLDAAREEFRRQHDAFIPRRN